MRTINTIALHHSVTPADWSVDKTVKAIEREHLKFKAQGQVTSVSYNIAYHTLIFPDGTVKQTRALSDIGFHAGNWPVNQVSIGVCLIGNYENDQPTAKMGSALKTLLESLINQYNIPKSNIKLHKEVRLLPTACPGKNINHAYIDSLLIHKPTMADRLARRLRILSLRKQPTKCNL